MKMHSGILKHTATVLMALLLFCPAGRLHSAETEKAGKEPAVNVKLNGLLAIGVINPAVEFRVFEYGTVQLEGMGVFQPYGFLGSKYPLTLGTTFGEFRYYPKKAFHGFFVAANAGWGVYRLSKGLAPGYNGAYPDSYQVGSNMMFGATIGYAFCIGKHWSIEINWGAGWQGSTYEGYNNDGTQYVGLNKSGEWLPAYKGGIFVGYRF